ncbi:MAG: hypothetical protein ACRDRW_12545 [Pseudonocardiaceae bacterium]
MPDRDDFPRARYAGGDPHDMPVDLAAVQDDDELLDLIGRVGHTPSDADDDLTRVLVAWRREVHAEPFRELVDTNTALAVIHAARQPARRRNPVFNSVAAAAAVLVIAFSSMGLVAKSAHPGDPLWGVTQVLYRDYAHSVQTADEVTKELDQAKVALQEGKPEQARAKLRHVQSQLPVIGDAEGRTDLTARENTLAQMLNESPDVGVANAPRVPTLPPPGHSSARSEPNASPKPSTAPKSSEAPTSTEPTSGTTATHPGQRIPVGPGAQGDSAPGPRGSSSIGPSGNIGPSGKIGPSGNVGPSSGSTTGGDANTGKAAPGTAGGTADGAITDDGGSPTGGPSTGRSPRRDPASSVPPGPSVARPSVTPPSTPAPPGCDRAGPRPFYCR